jgi:hypothetical protein
MKIKEVATWGRQCWKFKASHFVQRWRSRKRIIIWDQIKNYPDIYMMKENKYIQFCSMLYRNLCPSNTRVLQLQKIPSLFICLHCPHLILLCISLHYYHSIIVIFLLLFNNFFTSSSSPTYCPFKLHCTGLFFHSHLIVNGHMPILRNKWEDTKKMS